VVREKNNGGLFLSTSGYSGNAFEHLSVIDRGLLRFGSENKIVALCQTFQRAKEGLWSVPENIVEVINDQTE
jgi:restriction system protein